MTPAARFQAAIEILDAAKAGQGMEPALLSWTRSHRFAGSKDRAAIRDIVFSVDRRRRSCAAMGAGDAGRALLRGYLMQEGIDETRVFGSDQYAPVLLTPEEKARPRMVNMSPAEEADLQDWVFDQLQSQGDDALNLGKSLRERAPVYLRVNVARARRESVLEQLRADGFEPMAHATCATALSIHANERRLASSDLYLTGIVELQDVAPQSSILALGHEKLGTALDYCAGGGGKALAMAAMGWRVTAYDANPKRLAPVKERAKRAKAEISIAARPTDGKFDVVLCDVPCTGSGAWRRTLANKWTLSKDDLKRFVEVQRDIVRSAMPKVATGGRFAYMTCSLFAEENQQQAEWIARSFGLSCDVQTRHTPLLGSDGFFYALFSGVPSTPLNN